MSILGKFMDSVKFNSEDEDDDYFLDDEYDDEGYDEGSEGRKGTGRWFPSDRVQAAWK